MQFILKRRIILSALLVFFVPTTTLANKNEILFGSVAMDIPAVMHERLTPLTN